MLLVARPVLPRPTDGELELLKVLWEHGPLNVRDIHEKLATTGGPGFNSVLKRIQIMERKGYLVRDPKSKPAVYRTSIPKAKAQRHFISDLTKRVFNGSLGSLILKALGSGKVSDDELREIRRRLEKDESGEP